MSVETYCRFCATKFSLSSIKNSNKLKNDQLIIFVFKYLEIKITDNDEFPTNACKLCCKILTKFNQFLNKVKDAQQKLREIFSLSTINNLDIKLEHESQDQQQHNDVKTNSEEILVDSKIESNDVKTELEEDDYDNFDHFLNDYANETQESDAELANNTLEKKNFNVTTKIDNSCEESPSNSVSNNPNKLKKVQFKCYKCDSMFHSAEFLQDHFENIHKSKTEYVCLECNALFENLSEFEAHLYEHYFTNKSSKVYTCEICGKQFSRKVFYIAHQDAHSGVKRFQCKECGHQFRLKQYLLRHKRRHLECSDELEVKCTQCDKICKNQYLLECHMKSHIPPDEKYKYKCDICDRKFVAIEKYKCHQIAHENEKDYICDQCGKVFKSRSNLNSHLISHTQDTPYTCDECSKRFKSNTALKAHQLTHSGKFHECEVCGKKFIRRGQLTIHSSIHSGKLPYECSYCKKQFRRKYYLKVHLRQHTGERPYSCTECNHFFTCDSNFIKHLKGRHGLQNVSIANKRRYPFDD